MRKASRTKKLSRQKPLSENNNDLIHTTRGHVLKKNHEHTTLFTILRHEYTRTFSDNLSAIC